MIFGNKGNRERTGAVVIFLIAAVFGLATFARAGTITPPGGAPSASFFTLSQIYNFITANTPATQGVHDFTFSDALEPTFHTLTQIGSSDFPVGNNWYFLCQR